MSITTKFVAQNGTGKSILIRRNRLWENVEIYYEDRLIQTYRFASETREGALFTIEDLGEISLKVHSVTLAPTLLVNGTPYIPENEKDRPRTSLLIPTLVFGVLALFNLVFFAMSLEDYRTYRDWFVSTIVLLVSGFYLLSYIITTIFLARRIYFFYFYGTGIFIISTFCFVAILALNGISTAFLTLLIVRILALVLLLRYFKRAIRLLREHRSGSEVSIILDDEL